MQQATIVSSAVWKSVDRSRAAEGRRAEGRRAFQLAAVRRLASRAGKNAEFIATLNGMFRVKDEYSVPMDQKLDVEAFADSILKSNIDEEHDFAWLKEHAVYDHPRTVDEVYIWANGEPGRVPLYFDFLLEAKSKVEAKVAELGIPWEVDDYQALPDWKPGCGYEVTDPASTSSPCITPMRSTPTRGSWRTPGSTRSMKRTLTATPLRSTPLRSGERVRQR